MSTKKLANLAEIVMNANKDRHLQHDHSLHPRRMMRTLLFSFSRNHQIYRVRRINDQKKLGKIIGYLRKFSIIVSWPLPYFRAWNIAWFFQIVHTIAQICTRTPIAKRKVSSAIKWFFVQLFAVWYYFSAWNNKCLIFSGVTYRTKLHDLCAHNWSKFSKGKGDIRYPLPS